MKVCTECKETKPLSEFHKMRKWHRGSCRECYSKLSGKNRIRRKVCARCGRHRQLNYFAPDRRRPSGYSAHCKDCDMTEEELRLQNCAICGKEVTVDAKIEERPTGERYEMEKWAYHPKCWEDHSALRQSYPDELISFWRVFT